LKTARSIALLSLEFGNVDIRLDQLEQPVTFTTNNGVRITGSGLNGTYLSRKP